MEDTAPEGKNQKDALAQLLGDQRANFCMQPQQLGCAQQGKLPQEPTGLPVLRSLCHNQQLHPV